MSHIPTHSRHNRVSFNPLPNEPVDNPNPYGQPYTIKVQGQDISVHTNYLADYPVHRQPQETPNLARPSYKPLALRWPFLSLLFLSIIAGMGLMGCALHKLPAENSNVLDLHLSRLKRLDRRASQTPSSSPPTHFSSSTTSSGQPGFTSTRLPSDFGQVGVTVTITSSPSVTPSPTSELTESSVAGADTTGSTTTTGAIPPSDHGDVGTVIITESIPVTPTYVTAVVTTLTNSQGIPTYTATSTPSAFSTERATVLTNSLGQPTATRITSVLATPVVTTLADPNGVPTATVTSYPVQPTETAVVRAIYISYGEYFVGFFLPTVLSILLAIPIRILDLNAKLFQPWHELTHVHGATGRESLCRQTGGWQSVVMSLRSLLGGQVLVFLTTTLLVCSAVLVPLSAEAVTFRLYGSSGMSCTAGSMSGHGCAFVLSVFSLPARAAIGLLAFMAINVLFVVGVLVRWQTGVATNPWSIVGIAGLAHNREIRQLFASMPSNDRNTERRLKEALEERKFKLGWFSNERGAAEYGIMLYEEHNLADEIKNGGGYGHVERGRPNHRLPFFMLGYMGRLLFLFILCGTLAMILYYNNTGGETPFEDFMASESFGVRFLFTGIGVLITFLWTSFFTSLATLSPYLLLATEPQLARRSILLSPPTNAFSGVLTGLRRRHWFLATTAAAAVLSELLTVFLSNVPFRVTQTWLAARVCTWAAIGILGIMTLVVLTSFFCVRWPSHRAGAVPAVDPSTIAGAVYYVADSWMLADFEGIGSLKRSERDRRVESLRMKYEFGEITGVGGALRVAVDSVDDRAGGA